MDTCLKYNVTVLIYSNYLSTEKLRHGLINYYRIYYNHLNLFSHCLLLATFLLIPDLLWVKLCPQEIWEWDKTTILSQERLEYLGMLEPKYSNLNILFNMGRGTWLWGMEQGEIKCLFQLKSLSWWRLVGDWLCCLVADGMCAPTKWLLLNLVFTSGQATSPV